MAMRRRSLTPRKRSHASLPLSTSPEKYNLRTKRPGDSRFWVKVDMDDSTWAGTVPARTPEEALAKGRVLGLATKTKAKGQRGLLTVTKTGPSGKVTATSPSAQAQVSGGRVRKI